MYINKFQRKKFIKSLYITYLILCFSKVTRLSQVSLGNIATGQVVNLLSNDVSRFDLVVIGLHALWIMPFLVLIIAYFLWQEVGISCVAGIVSMALLSLPVQGRSLGERV